MKEKVRYFKPRTRYNYLTGMEDWTDKERKESVLHINIQPVKHINLYSD